MATSSQSTSSKKNAIPHFHRWSQTYERSWLQPRLFEPTHRAVLAAMERYLLAPPGSVLDVGCGTGRFLRAIHERWPDAELMGVDPTPGMVETARQLTSDARFEVGFAEALPLPDASVDVVVSTLSFHHWSDQAAGLREVARVLRPKGSFFLADVVVPLWLARFLPWLHAQRPAHFPSLFQQAGLRVFLQQRAVHGWTLITAGEK